MGPVTVTQQVCVHYSLPMSLHDIIANAGGLSLSVLHEEIHKLNLICTIFHEKVTLVWICPLTAPPHMYSKHVSLPVTIELGLLVFMPK